MSTKKGVIALMGSGELTATMVAVSSPEPMRAITPFFVDI
jgi:hypothetical protein